MLGTPTTTSTVGGDAWYYISQRVEQPIPAMPAKVTNQRVYAVYFDKSKRLTRIANYGLDDGRVIDMTSRQTVAAGGENRLLQGMLKQIFGPEVQDVLRNAHVNQTETCLNLHDPEKVRRIVTDRRIPARPPADALWSLRGDGRRQNPQQRTSVKPRN